MTGPRQPGGAPVYDQKQLTLIRASFVMGVAMFAVVTFFLHKQNGLPQGPPPDTLIYLPIVSIAVGLLSMFPLRTMWARETDPTKRLTLSFIGWAIGEAAALSGCVYYFFTDDPRFAIAGIFVLLATLMLFPIRRPD